MKKILISAAAGAIAALVSSVASAGTLDTVKQKGFLQCGANTGLAGFGQPDAQGNLRRIDLWRDETVGAHPLPLAEPNP